MAVFGLPWANLVQTRVMLSRTGRRRDQRTGRELPPQSEHEHDDAGEGGGDQDVEQGLVNVSMFACFHSLTAWHGIWGCFKLFWEGIGMAICVWCNFSVATVRLRFSYIPLFATRVY